MCFLGHDEYEQKVDITTVWRVEIHWGIEVGKGSDGSFTFGEAAVRNGYAFPYGRAAEALSEGSAAAAAHLLGFGHQQLYVSYVHERSCSVTPEVDRAGGG